MGGSMNEERKEIEESEENKGELKECKEEISTRNGSEVEITNIEDNNSLTEESVEGDEEEKELSLGSDEWYKRDKEAFDKAYPELDKEELFSNRDFLNFAEGKVGVRGLADIYSDYNLLVKTIREKAFEEAEREFENRISKAQSTPGSLTEVADVSDNGYYTLEEMKRMSQEFVEAHWDKVRESLRRINK